MAEEQDSGPRAIPDSPKGSGRRAPWFVLALLVAIGLSILVSIGIAVVVLRNS